jgi:hypothetical protein
MKINQKEITLIIFSVLMFGVSVFIMIKFLGVGDLFTSKKEVQQETQKNQEIEITGKFDEGTLEKLKAYKDYGSAELNNIGRVNPFGPLN